MDIDSMIQKGRNYTSQELKQLLGDNWQGLLGITPTPIQLYPKPIINNFNEFEQDTKQIYTNIYNIIKAKNPNQDIKVWATGSRVKGTWRTDVETDQIKQQYGQGKSKYSDYDITTDANQLPTPEYFLQQLGVKVDYAGAGGHKVLIEI